MIIVSATDMKNSFGHYLKLLKSEGEIMIEKHGIIIARISSIDKEEDSLSESIIGMLKKDEGDD